MYDLGFRDWVNFSANIAVSFFRVHCFPKRCLILDTRRVSLPKAENVEYEAEISESEERVQVTGQR